MRNGWREPTVPLPTTNQRIRNRHWANEIVRSALRFERLITTGEQEILNPIGVNCLRYFAGRGNRVWGARTISSDPEWKYVNVRRYFNYLDQYQPIHAFSTYGSWVLGTGLFMTAIYLLVSLKYGPLAPDNPWGGTTMEWQTSSPPITHNFEEQPVLEHEPYDYRPKTVTHA